MDDVGFEYEVGEVVEVAVEQAEVPRTAAAGVERLVELHDVAVVVAGRRRDEEDHRVVLAGQFQHVVVQRVVPPFHHGQPGTHRDDVTSHVAASL